MAKTPRRGKGKRGTKGHQTKLACGWCRKLGKECDAQRPCERCIQCQRCDDCTDAPVGRPRQGMLRPAGLRCPSQKKPKESDPPARVSKSRAEEESADGCSEGTGCDDQERVALDERIIPWLENVAEMMGNGTANHFEGVEVEYPAQDIGQVVSPFSDHSPMLYVSNEWPIFIWDDNYIHLTLEGFRNGFAYFRIRGLP